MTVKLLTEHHLEFLSLKGDSTGSSESTPVKIPVCWKSHVTTHIADVYQRMGFSLRLYAHYYALINSHDAFQLQATHVSIYVSDMPATFQLTFRLARVPERQVQAANRD